jgi:hypothetical protein
MNPPSSLSELKEGRYEIKKGHEAVQQLQNKLGRLQDTFEVRKEFLFVFNLYSLEVYLRIQYYD